MRPKNFKGGRCIKTKLKKCEEVARTYDKIQTAYADVLDKDKNVEVIKCNVLLENLEDGEFTTDFLCTKTNGDLMVRECVFRKKLSLPRTCKLLDASRKYWARRGITDWAIVVEEGESADEEELIAEITAEMLTAELHIPDDSETPENAVAYIHSWSSYLQDRPNEIVSAAAKAETACDLIMECLREMELEEQKVMNENIEEER